VSCPLSPHPEPVEGRERAGVRAIGGSAEWIQRLDSREFERKLKPSRARRSMTLGTKPVIFISYAHADEPENPREGEVQ
jgi:hypothetical protein